MRIIDDNLTSMKGLDDKCERSQVISCLLLSSFVVTILPEKSEWAMTSL